jgi:cytochrome P450
MNESILTGLQRADRYHFGRPTLIPEPTPITSYTTAKAILQNQKDFAVTWGEGLEVQIGAPGGRFMLSGDGPVHASNRCMMDKALHRDNWRDSVKTFYEKMTLKLLKQKSYKIAGTNQVDIVRE